jgi:hypothetical protein
VYEEFNQLLLLLTVCTCSSMLHVMNDDNTILDLYLFIQRRYLFIYLGSKSRVVFLKDCKYSNYSRRIRVTNCQATTNQRALLLSCNNIYLSYLNKENVLLIPSMYTAKKIRETNVIDTLSCDVI